MSNSFSSTGLGEKRSLLAQADQATVDEMDSRDHSLEQEPFEGEDSQCGPDDASTQQVDKDHEEDTSEYEEEEEQDSESMENKDVVEDESGEEDDDNNVPINNNVPVSNVALVNIVDDFAPYDYVSATDPCSTHLKLPSRRGSSKCINIASTPEALLYIEPEKMVVTQVPLPPFITNAALTNMMIANWSQMRHPLASIFQAIHNPAPVKGQRRAPGQGPRAGQTRDLGQQVPNRMSSKNARYRERNGLLAVNTERGLRKKIPNSTMGGMIRFSNAQWFFNVRGVLQRGRFTMTMPVDYYQGTVADASRSFNLPCPQDVSLLIRRKLAEHGRTLPTFLDFLHRNLAIVQHYNINMTTGMPFANGLVIVSPVITARPIVPVTAPIVTPVAAPVAGRTSVGVPVPAPVASAPVVSAPAGPFSVAIPSMGNGALLAQNRSTVPSQGGLQKRGREDDEDKHPGDTEKAKIGPANYHSSPQWPALAKNFASYDSSQEVGDYGQNSGVAAHRLTLDDRNLDPYQVSLSQEIEFLQQFARNNYAPQQEASPVQSNTAFGGSGLSWSEGIDATRFGRAGAGLSDNQDVLRSAQGSMRSPLMPNYKIYGNSELLPDMPFSGTYFESSYPASDAQNTFGIQDFDGINGGKPLLEEDTTNGYTQAEEAQDHGWL